jgi:hypothetical protein
MDEGINREIFCPDSILNLFFGGGDFTSRGHVPTVQSFLFPRGGWLYLIDRCLYHWVGFLGQNGDLNLLSDPCDILPMLNNINWLDYLISVDIKGAVMVLNGDCVY